MARPFSITNYEQSPWPQLQVSTANPPNVSLWLFDIDAGLLPNRLSTADRDAIPVPLVGLTIYNTDKLRLESFNGSEWAASDNALSPLYLTPPPNGTSAHTLLQNAVNSGQPIFLLPGTYQFSDQVNLPAGETNIAAALGGVTLQAIAGNGIQALFFYAGPSVTKARFSGIVFDGGMSVVGSDLQFVETYLATDVVFDSCQFQNNRGPCLAFSQSNYCGIQNSRFTNVGWWWKNGGPSAVNVTVTFNQSGTGNFVVNNTVDMVGGDFIDAGNQTGFIFQNNRGYGANDGWVNLVTGAGTGFLYLFQSSLGAPIVGNYAYGFTGNGIDLNSISSFSVTGNVSNSNGGAGISITGTSSGVPITNFTITGNVANDNYQGSKGAVFLTTNNTTSAGSPILSFASTTGVANGYYVIGTNIPTGTTVLGFTSTAVTMSANATGSGIANGASISFSPQYSVLPALTAGIVLGVMPGNGTTTISNGVVAANLATDDQSTKTQQYGLEVLSGVTLSNVTISADNQFPGNLIGPISNVTQQGFGSGSNASVLLNSFNSVASGNFGSIAGGFAATASGVGAIALGTGVIAQGANGVALGSAAWDGGYTGKYAFACSEFATPGDAQMGLCVLRGTTSSTSSVVLTANGSSATSVNLCSIANNTAYALTIDIIALDHTNVGNNESWNGWTGLLTRGANAASTAWSGNTTPTPRTNGTVTGSSISAAADTTNGGLAITFTPPTGNSDKWNVVAVIRTAEVK